MIIKDFFPNQNLRRGQRKLRNLLVILEEACAAVEEVAEAGVGLLEVGAALVIAGEEEAAAVLVVGEQVVLAPAEADQEVVGHPFRGRIGHGGHRRLSKHGVTVFEVFCWG